MKTAEEWAKLVGDCCDDKFVWDEVNALELVKEIQLDAMKEGMRRAARLCYPTHVRATTEEMVEFNSGVKQTKEKIETAILKAADNLTERDL